MSEEDCAEVVTVRLPEVTEVVNPTEAKHEEESKSEELTSEQIHSMVEGFKTLVDNPASALLFAEDDSSVRSIAALFQHPQCSRDTTATLLQAFVSLSKHKQLHAMLSSLPGFLVTLTELSADTDPQVQQPSTQLFENLSSFVNNQANSTSKKKRRKHRHRKSSGSAVVEDDEADDAVFKDIASPKRSKRRKKKAKRKVFSVPLCVPNLLSESQIEKMETALVRVKHVVSATTDFGKQCVTVCSYLPENDIMCELLVALDNLGLQAHRFQEQETKTISTAEEKDAQYFDGMLGVGVDNVFGELKSRQKKLSKRRRKKKKRKGKRGKKDKIAYPEDAPPGYEDEPEYLSATDPVYLSKALTPYMGGQDTLAGFDASGMLGGVPGGGLFGMAGASTILQQAFMAGNDTPATPGSDINAPITGKQKIFSPNQQELQNGDDGYVYENENQKPSGTGQKGRSLPPPVLFSPTKPNRPTSSKTSGSSSSSTKTKGKPSEAPRTIFGRVASLFW